MAEAEPAAALLVIQDRPADRVAVEAHTPRLVEHIPTDRVTLVVRRGAHFRRIIRGVVVAELGPMAKVRRLTQTGDMAGTVCNHQSAEVLFGMQVVAARGLYLQVSEDRLGTGGAAGVVVEVIMAGLERQTLAAVAVERILARQAMVALAL